MWDSISFIIGILVGLIIMLVVMWLLYSSRSLMFTFCPRNTPVCRSSDYYNDPGDAIAVGADPDDILSKDDQGKVFYHRVLRNSGCRPDHGQTIYIANPQTCTFTTELGSTFDATSISFNIPQYMNDEYSITTDNDCNVVSSTGPETIVSGETSLTWDPNPVPLN